MLFHLVASAKIGLSKWIFYVKNHPNLDAAKVGKATQTLIILEEGLFCKPFWKIGLPKVFDSEVNDSNIDHGQNCFELADGLSISF